MNKKLFLEYLICTILLILAVLLRFYKINNPIADWHSWRQADTSSVTRIFVNDGINMFYPRYYDVSSIQSGLFNPNGYRFVEFPVFNAISAIFYKLTKAFTTLEITERLVSIAFSFISAYFLFLIGKKYLGRVGGYLTSFFFLYLPFSIYYSRAILPEPTILSFALISLWLFIKYLKTCKNSDFIASSIFFSIALLLKAYVIFYALIPLFLLIQQEKLEDYKEIFLKSEKNIFNLIKIYRKVIQKFLVFMLISLTPLLLWRLWMSQFPEGIPFYGWALNGNGIRFKPSYWKWIYGERVGHLILGGWGLVIVGFGIVKRYRESVFNQLFLFSAVVYLTVVASANVLHDYYQILILPPLAFALAQGTLVLWNIDKKNRFLRRGLLAFSIIVMFISSGFLIKDYYNVNRWEITEAGKYVSENTPKDALVIAPYNGDTAFLYQTNRFGWPYRDRSLEELISRGADFFVSIDLNDPQTKEAESMYQVIEKNERFIVIDLEHKKI